MNFFGHAAIASDASVDPRFVLGAMLPDLAPMAGLRPPRARDPVVERGVALHHRTDSIFHRAPAFLDLCGDALERLTAGGLSRASARAVGHVGSELLLDGWLADSDPARTAYDHALRWARQDRLAQSLALDADGHGADLDRLIRRLRRAPVPEGYREPDFVAERLEHILARRRRLALAPGDGPAVRRWLARAQGRIDREADRLLAELRAALRLEMAGDA